MIYSSNKYANELEARTCRAKFFRFLSFISPKNLQPLVIKAGVNALAGIVDCSKIFTWENAKFIDPIELSALTVQASMLESNKDNEIFFYNKGKSGVICLDATGLTVVPFKQCQNNAKMNSFSMSRIRTLHQLDSLPLKLGTMYQLKPVSLDLDAVKQFLLWRDITRYPENMLNFSNLTKPQVGDVVRVLVKEQSQPEHLKNLLFVVVQDENYASVEGILTPSDISTKWVDDCRTLFNPRQSFYAKVFNITEDGKYRFSIRYKMDKYIRSGTSVEEDAQKIVLKSDFAADSNPVLPKTFIQELILLVDLCIRQENNIVNKIELIGYAYVLSCVVSDLKSYYYDFLLRYYATIEKFVSEEYDDIEIEFQEITPNAFVDLDRKKKLLELLNYVKSSDEDCINALQDLIKTESGNDVSKSSAVLMDYVCALEDDAFLEILSRLSKKNNSLVCNLKEVDLFGDHNKEDNLKHGGCVGITTESVDSSRTKVDIKFVSLVLNIFDDGSIVVVKDMPGCEAEDSTAQIAIPSYASSGFVLLMNNKGGLCKLLVKDIAGLGFMSKYNSDLNTSSLCNSFVVPCDCIVGVRTIGKRTRYLRLYKSEDIPCGSILTPKFIHNERSDEKLYQFFILPRHVENIVLDDSLGEKIYDNELSQNFIDTLNSYGVYI